LSSSDLLIVPVGWVRNRFRQHVLSEVNTLLGNDSRPLRSKRAKRFHHFIRGARTKGENRGNNIKREWIDVTQRDFCREANARIRLNRIPAAKSEPEFEPNQFIANPLAAGDNRHH
jgi:hypothetical protein